MNEAASTTQLNGMLTTRQVAEFLQVSISTVRRWGDQGMLQYYQISPRGDRRYQIREVLRFVGLTASFKAG